MLLSRAHHSFSSGLSAQCPSRSLRRRSGRSAPSPQPTIVLSIAREESVWAASPRVGTGPNLNHSAWSSSTALTRIGASVLVDPVLAAGRPSFWTTNRLRVIAPKTTKLSLEEDLARLRLLPFVRVSFERVEESRRRPAECGLQPLLLIVDISSTREEAWRFFHTASLD